MRAKRLFCFWGNVISVRHGWSLIVAVASLWPHVVLAAPAAGLTASKAAASEKSKEADLPKPKLLMLSTSDGLELAVTYYPGTKGKQTIPVVLLHMWKQNGNDYRDLALALQAMGHAAIVPDLRGHGQSTHIRGAGRTETLKAATLSVGQFTAMVGQDMKAIKAFLIDRNNAGELNIDKLCVVGAEMGAGVAINFAAADATEQENNRVFGADREYKRGCFVKALVLLSPKGSFPGLPMWWATANPIVQRDIAVLILVGKQDARALEEAKRLYGIFRKYHPEPTGEDKLDRETLFFGKFDTRLQGTKLLDPKFHIPDLIGDFIDRRLIKSDASKEWAWRERKSPY